MNTLGGTGLWDEEDGFYYDQLHVDGQTHPAARALDGRPDPAVRRRGAGGPTSSSGCPASASGMRLVPGATGRTWRSTSPTWSRRRAHGHGHRLLAIPVARAAGARAALPARRERVPLAVRHPLALARPPATIRTSAASAAQEYRVDYEPGESDTGLFGGNSNWRGPIWFPINYLLIEALERYHHFYGDDFAGRVSDRLGPHAEPRARWPASWRRRLARLFLPDAQRPPPLPRRRPRASPTIRTGATWCCSTSTSTATPAAGWGPATRPAGRRWSRDCWRSSGGAARLGQTLLRRHGRYAHKPEVPAKSVIPCGDASGGEQGLGLS